VYVLTDSDGSEVDEDVLSCLSCTLPPSVDDPIYRIEGSQVYGMDDTLSHFSDKGKSKGMFLLLFITFFNVHFEFCFFSILACTY